MRRDQIAEYIASTKAAGVHVSQIAMALEMSPHRVRDHIRFILADGRIVWVPDPCGGSGGGRRKRFLAAEFLSAYVPPVRPARQTVVRRVGVKLDKDAKATNPNGVKPTSCPSGKDHRFTFTPPPGWVGQITLDRSGAR